MKSNSPSSKHEYLKRKKIFSNWKSPELSRPPNKKNCTTEKEAKSLGVRGWCMNTRNDTVKGEIEATQNEFTQMRTWLEKTGSPTCRIDKVIFGDIKEIDNFKFESFTIKY